MTEDAAEIVETIATTVDVSAVTTLTDIYYAGAHYSMYLIGLMAAYVIFRHLVFESLKFNYYYYLEHGEFVLLWPMDGEQTKRTRIEAIGKEHQINDVVFVPWFAALLVSLFVIAVAALVVVAWPISMFTAVPMLILRLVAYRKRRKIAFTQKLKGEHLENKQ